MHCRRRSSGATIIIYGTPQGGPPPENQITLESLLAPMRSTETTEEPYAWESRDFLRRICVGKQVRFQITRPGMQPGRDYGSVFLVEGNENLALSYVAEGWCDVKEIKDAARRPSYYEDL
ncbi:putative ribonuclease TUDOR 1 [Paratrimastix pyriformis]|uniref:Ribonuclease TUDOR 1 n=1 Tax=Paratrimastix pyriformis TaxID=342808 RepID=A0ABQ8UED7_9EUKA|nr:putative ribonuclease TUDOR 1 [Paratrimastix pyriformis]